MRILSFPTLALLQLLWLTPTAVGQDVEEKLLGVATRELVGARIAEPPAIAGKRSPIGPQLYRRVVDSVVLVIAISKGPEQGFSLGTGVVVSPKGHVLTNWHVVENGEAVAVVPRNPELLKGFDRMQKEYIVASQLLAADPRRDLALLLMNRVPANVRSAPLAQAGSVEVGQDVYSVGHPKGLLWSYAEGVVSQIRPEHQWSYEDGTSHKATIIQTQTPIYQGSSGGGLFDGEGRVVGIYCGMADRAAPTLSFAIAVSEVHDWIQSLVRR